MERNAADLADRLMLVSAKLAHGMRVRDDTLRLTASQRQLLETLVKSGPAQPGQLMTRLGKHGTAIARTVSELNDRGLVERVVDASDRRCVRVQPTEAGRHAFNEELSSRLVPLAGQLAGLDPHALETLRGALELIETLVTE